LIATAKQNGRHLVSVVLGADGKAARNAVSRALLDYGFGKTKAFKVQYGAPAPKYDEDDEYYYETPAPKPVFVKASGTSGKSGVQFGAFGSERNAKLQQEKVYALFGLSTYLEQSGGMFRVRAKMSESDAQKTRSECPSRGIDCFVFH
jgi:D-alanyl-D-alanine carboxypeptidase